MSWDHAKFHDFQACFGIRGIKKPSFSIFPAEPWRPDVWISLPSLAWDIEIHPRTHMWFSKQLWCTGKFSTVLLFGLICLSKKIKAGEGIVRMSFRTRRWHVPSQNHEPSWGKLRFARSLHLSLSQFVQIYYRNMLVPCHETMPSFMIFRHVLELEELKNQVSQSFRPSHDAQMFEFHSHLLHGT